ncbi:hypothetical protein CDL12_07369 [Handroanthus impetiginosus]|uniref:Transcription factor, Myb superfamily n=1 Tax=Handroanthus impetiginosus TaxID=429701 RepID=A0A2G9HQZ3_9LAMI|nr:hypothetical protein CDL12_07369 [Handroanthus impetiginosus]
MAHKNDTDKANKRSLNKGAWTADEDKKLAAYVEKHGPKRWKSVAMKSGLNRCGKSCRLRWLNYLRPDIKRGSFSDAEDDLILRLHRLLGNRWSLIAKRLPGRTDNEIKNHWNAHLRKKAKSMEKLPANPTAALLNTESRSWADQLTMKETQDEASGDINGDQLLISPDHHDDASFDFSTQGTNGMEWVKTFLELEDP